MKKNFNFSSIAIGCEQLGEKDWGDYDIKEVKRAIDYAFVNNFRIFETADVYGLGRSEEFLQEVLGKRINDSYIITKGGLRWDSTNRKERAIITKDLSPKYLSKALDNSLKRLKVDAVSMYMLHWPDFKTPYQGYMDFLSKALEEGKILNYGLSNFPLSLIKEIKKSYVLENIQVGLNILNWQDSEKVLRYALTEKMKSITYGTLSQGLLTGKYSHQTIFNKNDRRSRLEIFSNFKKDFVNQKLKVLEKISKKYNKEKSQVAIRWALDCGLSSLPIVGIKSIKHLNDLRDLNSFKLNYDEVEILKK